MFLMSIPKIGDDELKNRYARVKPVVTVDGKMWGLREYSLKELKNKGFYHTINEDRSHIIPAEKLEPWENHDFLCLHPYGYPEKFNPTVSEVLSQIPRSDLWWVKAFEIIEAPTVVTPTQMRAQPNSLRAMAHKNGYHVSMVRLYVAK